jgi:hypothetical protein
VPFEQVFAHGERERTNRAFAGGAFDDVLAFGGDAVEFNRPEMPVLPFPDRAGFLRRAGKDFFVARIFPDFECSPSVALLTLYDCPLRAGRFIAKMIGQNPQALRLGKLSSEQQADKCRQQSASSHSAIPLYFRCNCVAPRMVSNEKSLRIRNKRKLLLSLLCLFCYFRTLFKTFITKLFRRTTSARALKNGFAINIPVQLGMIERRTSPAGHRRLAHDFIIGNVSATISQTPEFHPSATRRLASRRNLHFIPSGDFIIG